MAELGRKNPPKTRKAKMDKKLQEEAGHHLEIC
jgi:hypothetical protein